MAVRNGGFASAKEEVVVAVVRAPSSPKPDGFCGAGYEDHMLLLSVRGNALRLVDKVLIQSCLDSISLQSEQGSEHPRDVLLPGALPVVAYFEQMAPPDFAVRRKAARIDGGRILVVDAP